MKSLTQHIQEKLVVNNNYKKTKYHPTTTDELSQIIEQRYKEQGPGTEQEPINFNDVDVSGMTVFYDEPNSKGIFEGTKFEYIDISDWDVSNVKNMHYLFYNCKPLKSVGDLSYWNVSNVENMCLMFGNCYKLESVGDLSNWNVSNVEKITRMFKGCTHLKSVGDLNKWDISNMEFKADIFKDSGITNIPKWYEE